MNCSFSLNHYQESLRIIHERGYRPIFFDETSRNGKEILIRHDIDVDPSKARIMAEMEYKENIKSTYFFWISSPFYNALDKKMIKVGKEILQYNHRLGLHYYVEPKNPLSMNEMGELILREAAILEKYYDTSVNILSFHMPVAGLYCNELCFPSIMNTYHKDFVMDFKYVSDSSKNWREGCLCEMLQSGIYDKIQVLIHPVWWTAKESEQYQKQFLEDKDVYLANEWSLHIKV